MMLLSCCWLVWCPSSWARQTEVFWLEAPPKSRADLPTGYSPPTTFGPLIQRLQPAVVQVYTDRVPVLEKGEKGSPASVLPWRSLGSGFIISQDGYVLTNSHVASDLRRLWVRLADNRSLRAKRIGVDQDSDVALLKIETETPLPVLVLGNSDTLQVGDWVLAMGNPFGASPLVSVGIINAKGRQVNSRQFADLLQTDASIHADNAGGPLCDVWGHVVGINSSLAESASGIGFAVPSQLIKRLLPQLRQYGRVRRGWLGIDVQELNPALRESLEIGDTHGVLVSQVYRRSPASRAGLRAGDVIVSLNGVPVTDKNQLTSRVSALLPSTLVRLKLLRQGVLKRFKARLEARQKQAGPVDEKGVYLGLVVIPLATQKTELGDARHGLLVQQIQPGSKAQGVVQPGDVILQVDRKPVATLLELKRFLAEPATRKRVLLLIQRADSQTFVVVDR